ncbi:MAG: alpha/beta hydrolase [Pseudomonadota bacterium]
MTPTRVEVGWNDRLLQLEALQISGPADGPLLVFLHEGLGSVSMWRDFPTQLCERLGARGLVYSRPGYGRSTPRAQDERWGVDFMHRQAHEVLPALLQTLKVQEPIWLVGHSDGGSIALLYAARHGSAANGQSQAPEAPPLAGAIVLAPHILVEDVSVRSIEQARQAYLHTDLRQRLARHHDDPDSAFWGWNDIWLSPAFRSWSIEADLHRIKVPVLAVQGVDDEYGTLEQIRGIARHVPQTELLELPACGHSPHRDQPQALMEAVAGFVGRHAAR